MRISITARLALLAIGLALISSLALSALVWQQTHAAAMGELRRDTIEQSDAFAAVFRSGGLRALGQAITTERAGDGTLVAEVVDGSGRRVLGAGPDMLAAPPGPTSFRLGVLGTSGPWAQRESGYMIREAGDQWLVTGRVLDDWERAQRTIERALLAAMLLAVVLGVAGGLVLTRYVSRRLDHIAGAVDAVAAGDLNRRVGATGSGGGDAFDRLAHRINGMLDRIDRLMGELRVVTDSVAHDLRSPIARLRARAETAVTADDPAQRDAALSGLIPETDLVMRMLGVLLEISRTEAATRDAFARIDPSVLIEEIADLYEPVAEEAGLAFSIAIVSPPPAAVPLHRELLSQAVANLIDNAMRHAAAGGSIVLGLTEDGGTLRIAVADRGPGIAAEDRAEALRRFGRLDSARSLPGAGLGLALVEAVARLHGGRLELAENDPGLVATLVLPV
jgi:signal transduction histidine kinase